MYAAWMAAKWLLFHNPNHIFLNSPSFIKTLLLCLKMFTASRCLSPLQMQVAKPRVFKGLDPKAYFERSFEYLCLLAVGIFIFSSCWPIFIFIKYVSTSEFFVAYNQCSVHHTSHTSYMMLHQHQHQNIFRDVWCRIFDVVFSALMWKKYINLIFFSKR